MSPNVAPSGVAGSHRAARTWAVASAAAVMAAALIGAAAARDAVRPSAGSDIVINELLADNKTGLADPDGQHDDWVELYNRGRTPLALAGLYLSDDPADPLAYALPDVIVARGEHVLVWCDNDPEQGPDHADFRLSKDGEQVVLSTESATLELVAFGPQETDVSWGRTTDGADAWGRCPAPSPRQPNACGAGAPSPTAATSPTPPTSAPPGPSTPPGATATSTGHALPWRIELPLAVRIGWPAASDPRAGSAPH